MSLACFEPLIRYELSDGRVVIMSMKKVDALQKAGEDPQNRFLVERVDTIPCGRCDGCQADRARKWADRLLLEKQMHEDAWFVTLTFNDEWLPRMCGGTKWPDMYSVRRRHLQLFMKRLRKQVKYPIRFFACGEYGSEQLRPHYHLILFGLPLPDGDMTYLRDNKLGQKYYTSKLIEDIWSDPDTHESYGFNVVAAVEYDSMNYVARYCMKKLRGQDSLLYEAAGMEPPFITMSRNPGIGYWWSIQNPEWYEKNLIYVETDKGSKTIVPPRYFEKRLAQKDPNQLYLNHQYRKKLREYSDNAVISRTDLTPYEYVKGVEQNVKKSLDVLNHMRNSGIVDLSNK